MLTEVQKYHIDKNCFVKLLDTGAGCRITFDEYEDIECTFKKNKLTIDNHIYDVDYKLTVPKWQIKPLIGLYVSNILRKYGLGAALIVNYDKDNAVSNITGSKSYGFSSVKFSKKDIASQTLLAKYLSNLLSSDDDSDSSELIEEFKSGEGFLFLSDFLGGKLL